MKFFPFAKTPQIWIATSAAAQAASVSARLIGTTITTAFSRFLHFLQQRSQHCGSTLCRARCWITFQELFFPPFSAVFCFGWIAAPFFISFQDFRLVWSDSRDLYCNMGIIEEVTPLHPFLHMERERGKKKKNPSWAVNGYSQFHPAFGPVQNSCAFFLTRTHTHTFISFSCSAVATLRCFQVEVYFTYG